MVRILPNDLQIVASHVDDGPDVASTTLKDEYVLELKRLYLTLSASGPLRTAAQFVCGRIHGSCLLNETNCPAFSVRFGLVPRVIAI